MASRFEELLNQYAGVNAGSSAPVLPDKRNDVEAASARKQTSFDPYKTVISRSTTAGIASASPMERDARNLDPTELFLKYGSQASEINSQIANAGFDVQRDRTAQRSGGERLSDNLASGLLGYSNSILGIGALGAGLISPEAGVSFSSKLGTINNSVRENSSEGLKASRRLNDAVNSLSFRDNEKKDDGSFVGGLAHVGRDVITAVSNAADNPNILEDTVASGLGSLFSAGPVSKILSAAGKATIGRTAIGRAASVGVAEAAPVAGAIGLTEGGGAYQQTAEQAYNELQDRTDLTEDQKIEMANRAGLMATAIQAPVGALTGTLVSKFEGNPVTAPTVRRAVGNVVREGIEEGIQSGSGQVAQNLAIQQEVNPEQSLVEGVGEQIGLGAIGGIGSAGVVQTPGVVLNTALETAKLPFAAGKQALTFLGDRVEARNLRVQDEILQGLHDQASIAVPDAQTEADNIIQNMDGPEQSKASEFVSRTLDRLGKTSAIQDIAKRASDVKTNVRDRLMALTELSSLVQDTQTSQEEATPESLAGTTIDSIKNVVANIGQSETVQKALSQGKELYDQYAPTINNAVKKTLDRFNQTQTDDVDLNSDMSDAAQLMLGMAEQTPDRVDPDAADQILYHSENGNVELTPQQKLVLRSASATARAVVKGSELGSKYNLPNAETVARQVLTDNPKEGSKLSLKSHLDGIRSAYGAGDFEGATYLLGELRGFAQSQINKLVAFNEALVGGNTSSHNPVRYKRYVGNGRFLFGQEALRDRNGKLVVGRDGKPLRLAEGVVHLSPRNANSIKVAQQVAIEALTLGTAVNNLSDVFPDLGIEHVDIPSLDASLDGDASTVAKEYLTGQRVVPTNELNGSPNEAAVAFEVKDQEVQPSEVVETEPDKVEEPSPALADSEQSQNSDTVAEKPQVEEILPEVKLNASEPNQKKETQVSEIEEDKTETESPDTVEKAFPALIGSNENRLRRAFKIPKNKTTRTFGVDSPAQIVKDGLKDETSFRQLIDGDLNRKYTSDIAQKYSEYLQIGDAVLASMNKRLQKFVNKPAVQKAGIDKATSWINGQAMNIVEKKDDGTFVYNTKLIENAMLAGLQWYLKMNQHGANLDDADVRNILRLPSDAVLPEGLVDRINDGGIGASEMARSLSREISRFWGLDQDSNAPRNEIEGVTEGVAKEILMGMIDTGLLKKTEIDISDITSDPKITKLDRYRMNTVDEEGKVTVIPADHPIRQFPTAIEKAVLFDVEEIHYIGEKPKAVAKTQLRNQLVENTPEQTAALQKQQDVSHRFNMPFVETLQQMGESMVLRLFGGGDLKSANLNVNHERTLAGRNLTLQSAYISIMSLLTEVENKADMDGVDVGEMPVYFTYNDTVVNRAQMLGKDNPQSNKLMREAILPTWKVLDLTDGQTLDRFYMGLAQALGEKVHTQAVDESIKKLHTKLAGFEKTLELLSDNRELRFTPEAVDMMKSEGVSSIAGFHALMEYARYQRTEDKTKFRTSIYFEADGVTNGVVNAMALFSSGPFTAEWLENIARGGYNVGEAPLSLAQIRTRFAKASADLYGLAGTKTTEHVRDLRNQYLANEKIMTQFNAVRDVLTEFIGDISINENNDLIVDRGAVKNPLTITIYGSGAKGIAGNITDEVISKIYERMSLTAQRMAEDKTITEAQAFYGGDVQSAQIKFDRLMSNLSALMANRLVSNNGELDVQQILKGKSESFGDPKKFTFPKSGIETLRENVLHAFINPMVSGITDTVGSDLMDTLGIIKTQVQAWSLVGKFAYQQEYNKAILAKREANPKMSKNELLSRSEEDAILKKVWSKLPYFSTGSQNFLFGMKQSKDTRTEFARGFNDELDSPAFGYTPDDAGVSGIPGITIGTGDGQTVLNAIADPEMPEGFLQIFDGIHSSVADMETMGRVANRAVFNAWQRNPLGDLTKAFSKFVSDLDLSDLTEDQRKELTKSLFPPKFWRVAQTSEAITRAFQDWAKRGETAAQGVAERHAVMAKVQSSIDQMAGAAAPHFNKGLILSGSPEQKAVAMEQLRQNISLTEPETESIPTISAKQVTPNLLGKMLDKSINKLTNDRLTRALVRDVVRSSRVDDYAIHIGSRAELLTKAADLGIQIPKDRMSFKGFIHPASQSIFVVNGNPETILHELVHAATYETIQAYYAGEQINPDQVDAIKRLEGLMEEFKNANLEGDAFQNALDEMERQASNGNQAAELNEFMAWSLANADLAEKLSKTKVENKALRIARSVVQALKQLLWGGKRSAAVKDDLFTNIRFNTSVIMRSESSLAQTASEGVLFHDAGFGQNDRLNALMDRITSKITDYAKTDPMTKAVNKAKLGASLASAARVSQAFQNAGFNMTKQEQIAFIRMVAVMGTDAELDPNSTVRMQELFTHVGKHLSLESFMRNPEANDPGDIDQATQKFNIVMGKFTNRKDAYDRSVVLPAFVALATVDEGFRKILSEMEMPKTKYAQWNSVDNILDNIGDSSVDNLSRWMSGEGVMTKDVQSALDNLMAQMLETAQESELFIEKFTAPAGNGIDRVNQVVIDGMEWIGDKAADTAARTKANNPDAKYRIMMAESLRTVTGLLNEKNGLEAATQLMSSANRSKVWRPMYDLLKDLVGRTEENAKVYDLIKIARTWVNGIRQQYREQFPRIIDNKFSRQLTADEHTHLYRGLGETGFAALMRGNKIERVLEMLEDQAARDVEVKNLRDKIEALSPTNLSKIDAKAQQLARYMITKKNDQSNLLRNAEAIAHLLGVDGVKGTVTTQAMIDHIDHLVSLYALNQLDEATRASLSSLVQSEAKGLGFILSYLQGQDEIDRAKAKGNARFNHFKGHMPSEAAQGVSLIIAQDDNAAKLIEKSYTRLKVYEGSSNDPTSKKRGYYFAPVSARAPFSQGIMQNVQQTVSGVDVATGFSTNLTAGVITDPKLVQKISSVRTKESGNTLMPVYDENGNLYAYERSIDPQMLSYLQAKTDIAKAMGIRSGRQVEEALANDLNKTLIDRLRDMYDADKKVGRANEYIDLSKSKDPIHKDAVKIFSNETRDYIKARFPEGFYVRKDMIDDAVGYRSASIGDAWTGNSRWSPETQEQVRKFLMGIFGNKAYQYAIKSEELLQNVIQDIRVAIVIKSIVVPMANAASNIFQLIARGVPAVNLFRSIPKKTAEIESWHKSRIRQIEAEAELLATTDILERRRLEAEIQTIKDAHKRLSIWPLLEAGEFSSISDAGSRDDILLTEGKLSEYLERTVRKLPKSVQTAGRYAIISKDTALFRALQKSVEYGDFVAKAVLYDDLTKRQGRTKQEALARVTEEFVNYDRLPGRDRAYLEGIGLLWFYNFKIRSAKVAVSMIRNNPVHSLIAASLPLPMSGIGLPLQDNLWSTLFDGRASGSVGFGMAFRAPGLLPMGNLLW